MYSEMVYFEQVFFLNSLEGEKKGGNWAENAFFIKKLLVELSKINHTIFHAKVVSPKDMGSIFI